MSYRVTVDISDVRRLTREANASLRGVPDVMHKTLEAVAAKERADHGYQNRTGDLEASTFASVPTVGSDECEVILAARTHYAEFVNRRGLMRIDERAQEAATELEYLFDSEAERIGRF